MIPTNRGRVSSSCHHKSHSFLFQLLLLLLLLTSGLVKAEPVPSNHPQSRQSSSPENGARQGAGEHGTTAAAVDSWDPSGATPAVAAVAAACPCKLLEAGTTLLCEDFKDMSELCLERSEEEEEKKDATKGNVKKLYLRGKID